VGPDVLCDSVHLPLLLRHLRLDHFRRSPGRLETRGRRRIDGRGRVAADIARNIETLDLSLTGVMENLKFRGIEDMSPKQRQVLLFDRSVAARHLSAIAVISDDGRINYDSRTTDPSKVNLLDRDYVQVHKHNDAVGLFIARPIISRITGASVIPFSRRLAKADGSFGGVVLGTMRLDYLEKAFKAITLGPGVTVTLARTDGIVLVRSPADADFIERDRNPARIIDLFAETPVGQFEITSTVDGTKKLFNYNQVGELPLVVAIGQPTGDIFAQWRPQAYAIGALIAALVASTIALVAFLNRNLKLRARAEAELAALATTDGLTGLANRRSFNDTLDRQWRVARAHRIADGAADDRFRSLQALQRHVRPSGRRQAVDDDWRCNFRLPEALRRSRRPLRR
jgi:hypothetical protein